jgi:hypothetical protein
MLDPLVEVSVSAEAACFQVISVFAFGQSGALNRWHVSSAP